MGTDKKLLPVQAGKRGGVAKYGSSPCSTIMLGKVNPVVTEMVILCGIRVMANDCALTVAASRGEFELNAFLPLVADSFLESLELLCRAAVIFRAKCVETLEAVPKRCWTPRSLSPPHTFRASAMTR